MTLPVLAQMRAGRGSPPRESAANRPPPLVTLTKTDGSTLRGEVVSSTPENVVFKPARKPNEQTDPEQVTLAWSEIKKLSNGLTQQKALETWKNEHREQLCESCRGNRALWCEVCKGTTHSPQSAAECKTCKGELLIDCKTPKCDQGTMPCPSPCLKLTDGSWKTKPDGSKVRTFRGSGGLQEFTEQNVGELIVVSNGNVENKGKCPTCGGRTKVDCPTCLGYGKNPCATCLARKEAPACTNACDHGRSPCQTCKGTGLKQ
jgi:hypothetical protein